MYKHLISHVCRIDITARNVVLPPLIRSQRWLLNLRQGPPQEVSSSMSGTSKALESGIRHAWMRMVEKCSADLSAVILADLTYIVTRSVGPPRSCSTVCRKPGANLEAQRRSVLRKTLYGGARPLACAIRDDLRFAECHRLHSAVHLETTRCARLGHLWHVHTGG
ncbi:hypothetical protein OH77DRAFT_680983 [Trametes cingulata]|nr:hypothetical protein OH77DRAFT_680983 [Trametes cingulata]